MLHAILSDVHGNLEALEAVLADVARHRPASMVCLGDFVGYGASPNECIDRLKPIIEHAVVGNHDLASIGLLRAGEPARPVGPVLGRERDLARGERRRRTLTAPSRVVVRPVVLVRRRTACGRPCRAQSDRRDGNRNQGDEAHRGEPANGGSLDSPVPFSPLVETWRA